MKHLKLLGLVVVASAALMAFVGASTASAGILCKNYSEPCNSILKKGETLSSQLAAKKKARINITFAVVECNKSTLAGKVAKQGAKGEVPEVTVETLSFTECNCEVFVLKDGTYYVSTIPETGNGMAIGTGQEFVTQCNTIFGKLKCTWVTNNTPLGEVEGGSPALIDVFNADPLLNEAASNPLCEEEAFWYGEYEITNPNALFVVSE
jgi:hypothetical protein